MSAHNGYSLKINTSIKLLYRKAEYNRTASYLGVRAHSTMNVASSKALSKSAPQHDDCDAPGWSSLHTYIRFYIRPGYGFNPRITGPSWLT